MHRYSKTKIEIIFVLLVLQLKLFTCNMHMDMSKHNWIQTNDSLFFFFIRLRSLNSRQFVRNKYPFPVTYLERFRL